jgi:hypothetical protein
VIQVPTNLAQAHNADTDFPVTHLATSVSAIIKLPTLAPFYTRALKKSMNFVISECFYRGPVRVSPGFRDPIRQEIHLKTRKVVEFLSSLVPTGVARLLIENKIAESDEVSSLAFSEHVQRLATSLLGLFS